MPAMRLRSNPTRGSAPPYMPASSLRDCKRHQRNLPFSAIVRRKLALGLVEKPCPRRSIIRWSPRFILFGSQRGRKASASDGFQSLILSTFGALSMFPLLGRLSLIFVSAFLRRNISIPSSSDTSGRRVSSKMKSFTADDDRPVCEPARTSAIDARSQLKSAPSLQSRRDKSIVVVPDAWQKMGDFCHCSQARTAGRWPAGVCQAGVRV
jgi:hypothetical protein